MTINLLGARLNKLRRKENKSLQEVANAVDTSKPHMWEIEKGATNPTLDLATKLAKYFNVSISNFIDIENSDNAK